MSGSLPTRRVIQIELNEISYATIQKLCKSGELPHFERISKQWSHIHTTSETQYEQIEPWIQWITAHTGKSFAEHQVFHLADSDKLEHPQIWELLSDVGVESAIVGSMNAFRGSRTKGGLFFPDPWAKDGKAYPEALQPLWDVISAKVQGHAVSDISPSEILKVFAATFRYGISPDLYAKIAFQILGQKLEPLKKWRLAGLFDEFLADIFLSLLGDRRYRFCTLFLNSVAHYQHHYWRNFEPEQFSASVRSPDCRSFDDPVRYGYKLYDAILGKILARLDLTQDLVMIVSGLSQVPYTHSESQGGMNYYRLLDHQQFLNATGLAGFRAFPMMSRDWQVAYANEEEKQKLYQTLGEMTVGGEKLFKLSSDREHYVFLETAVTKGIPTDQQISLQGVALGEFHCYFKNIAIKSGHHTGLGSLWVSKPEIVQAESTLPLTEVFHLGLSTLGARVVRS